MLRRLALAHECALEIACSARPRGEHRDGAIEGVERRRLDGHASRERFGVRGANAKPEALDRVERERGDAAGIDLDLEATRVSRAGEDRGDVRERVVARLGRGGIAERERSGGGLDQ